MLGSLWDVEKKGLPTVGFVGFGISNRGVYDALAEELAGARVKVRSEKETAVPEDAFVSFGERYLDGIDEDILFVSPGIRRDLPALKRAKNEGRILSSDADLFFRVPRKYVFAVTGSDGKSSTVSLTGHLLRRSGRFPAVAVCGNNGYPFCRAAREVLGNGAFCAELSSFMLSDLAPGSRRAVITNLTPNHADWHLSPDEYREAKLRVYEKTDEPVLNADCPELRSGKSLYALFSVKKDWRELSRGAHTVYTVKDGWILRNGEKAVPVSDIPFVGEHGIKNTLAALCLSDGFLPPADAREILPSFEPLPHRAETVAEAGGVTFVDSSIDSTPSRTAATLSAFGGGVWLLLGGRGKNVPFSPLFPAVAERCHGVILFGEIAEEAEEYLNGRKTDLPDGFIILRTGKMAEAVPAAYSLAGRGDTVLLSPGATSFDEFGNYEERGLAFRHTVGALLSEKEKA